MSTPDLIPVPLSEPDEATFHVCRFNEAYLEIVLGALDFLVTANVWDVSSDAELEDARLKAHELIAQIAEFYVCP